MKKLLCMLLAVMMVLGGVSAFAEDASYKIAILDRHHHPGRRGILRRYRLA